MEQHDSDSPFQRTLGQLVELSRREGYCDITFRNRKPLIGVRIGPALNAALMYGAGAKKLAEMLDRVETRGGETFKAADVWVIVEFPYGLPSEVDLAGIDLRGGDNEVQPGVSMREMTKQIYHCSSEAETEAMLRRVLAA